MLGAVIDLLPMIPVTVSACVATWWLCRLYPKAVTEADTKAQRAAEALARVVELTIRAAGDLEHHSGQVGEINAELMGAANDEPAAIVTVVTKLLETNQRFQERLDTTEDKLRQQAAQIETQMAEACRDALTLLANRRAFDNELARRLAEFQRHGRIFSLILADIDHFKQVNDQHGHPAGDAVLRAVAKTLRRTTRDMDLVARYGGEEFAIVLPGTPLIEARGAAARVREAIERCSARTEEASLHVTASFGVAQILSGEPGAALIRRADRALYAAKEDGRNCVHWHDGENIHRAEAPQCRRMQAAVLAPPASGSEPPADSCQGAAAAAMLDPDGAMPYGLPSRTTFCQHVRARMAEWKRSGGVLSLVLAKVNQYDRVRETGGRQVQVMQLAAKFIATAIREMDLAGHYTAGCFSLLLPSTAIAEAGHVAERIRDGFAQCSPRGPDGRPWLTMSVGVVQVVDDDEWLSLLNRAEAALAEADRRGGNCCCYHNGEKALPITALFQETPCRG